ncbi:MAG: hypothetical protein NC930_09755 [Candidatus Omnitrophica bacterium]|nr:hypothetical protein [Candidatus Omnitrophota bacterium]
MIKPWKLCLLTMGMLIGLTVSAFPEDTTRIHVTILTASNFGSDFNLENDAFRDQLLNLFSYTSYNQTDKFFIDLPRAKRQSRTLPGGYEFILTLQNKESGRILVQAVIRKGGQQYVDTVLSILNPGVVFLGGPPVEKGVLILVLETGY